MIWDQVEHAVYAFEHLVTQAVEASRSSQDSEMKFMSQQQASGLLEDVFVIVAQMEPAPPSGTTPTAETPCGGWCAGCWGGV